MDGLGFNIKLRREVDGPLHWCWLALGGASPMLQRFTTEGHDFWRPESSGLELRCALSGENAIAIYREARARGLEATEPQVGNAMWVTSMIDPGGLPNWNSKVKPRVPRKELSEAGE